MLVDQERVPYRSVHTEADVKGQLDQSSSSIFERANNTVQNDLSIDASKPSDKECVTPQDLQVTQMVQLEYQADPLDDYMIKQSSS